MQFYWKLHLNKISTNRDLEKGVEENLIIFKSNRRYLATMIPITKKIIATDDYLLTEKLIDERKGRLGQLLIIW